MPSSELTLWMAFDSIEPIGQRRGDYQAALMAASFVNHSMSPPKKPAKIGDLVLAWNWAMPAGEETPAVRAARIKALLMGGKPG